ncbi:ABC-type proline/glycine betaine transport system, ATPase component [Terriglobus roseus DSM 18391]|uniref:ABC-type proline/glycine betaine transport system, ATPase component n=1 Tax=Terriglobus roseus (strain DSM 18391 / NRRL B-41598 / KBS 63) TaxID=926566 RepID=I3ZEQ1_TERRK|nr:ATP-binding cassette domain-containing protein [Terriglobus roseus]AFL87719.1 ABC-type proline/glycine betaine transport system, ATPase component [Terriglobus roseus DSM 18391]
MTAAAGSVEFTHVSFAPHGVSRPILNDISLTLEAGTTTALLGRSGSGKTTLLRTVNGLVLPTGGSVRVSGNEVVGADLIKLRRGIGYVIQETGLYPHMSIERNVALPLELAGKTLSERTERAHALLHDVGLEPSQYATRMPWQLSGGQRQRAGVARALAADPAILLLDEPFGALDPLTRAEMQTMLRDLLARLGKTAVLVTHDLQEAIFLAHRVIFIDAGNVAADLPSQDVLKSDLANVKEYVRAVNRFEAAG